MVLILLFLLSSVFLFLNAGPLAIAGLLFSICYLPGMCLMALGKRGNLLFEDLILSFPCSIGISGILTVGMLFLGININHVPIIIHTLAGIAVLMSAIAKNKKMISAAVTLNRQELIFCLFALLMILLLSIPFFIGPNRGPIASHAFHHSSFVSQILNGIFPPENPGLGGTRIGYYWGFHALIAGLASQTDFHHLQIVFTLNALSLFFVFCIAYSFARAFGLSEKYCYIMPLAIIGFMRFDAGLFVVYKLLSGNLISIEKLTAQYKYLLPNDVLNSWMGGMPWLDTRLFYINKLYNISAMPLAINLCFSYLLLLLLFIKKNLAGQKIYLVCLGIIIMACILNYPPLAIFPLLHYPVWALFYIFLSGHGRFKGRIIEASKVLLPYLLGVLAVLPYLLFIIAGRDVSSSGQGRIIGFDFYNQSLKNIMVYVISFPVILYGVWVTWKKFSISREFFFLLTGTALCLGLTVFTRWPFDNSYKYNYILEFFLVFLFVFALSRWLSQISSRLVNRIISSAVILFLVLTPLLVEASYIVSCLSMDYTLKFSSGHILYAQDKQKNEAYAWIRENTPPETLLILTYGETAYPCCGVNRIYETAAIAERNVFVIKDTDYTTSNPEYAKRQLYRQKLFENPDDSEVIDFFSSLNRPIYFLFEEGLSDRYLVEERFKHFPINPGKPFVLSFKNDRQRVYLITDGN